MRMEHFMTSSLETISYTDHTCRDWVVIEQGRTLPDDWVQIEIQGWDAMVKAELIVKHKVTWIVKEIWIKCTH